MKQNYLSHIMVASAPVLAFLEFPVSELNYYYNFPKLLTAEDWNHSWGLFSCIFFFYFIFTHTVPTSPKGKTHYQTTKF